MLCSFTLFVSSFGFIDPEKPHWGSGQVRYLIFILFFNAEIYNKVKSIFKHCRKRQDKPSEAAFFTDD